MMDKPWYSSKKFLGALVPTIAFCALFVLGALTGVGAEVLKELVSGMSPMLGIVWAAQVGGQALVDREKAKMPIIVGEPTR